MVTIDTADFRGKKVLIRVDFNVPLDGTLKVADDTRMRAAIPTIMRVVEGGGTPIIMSHLGRPKNGFEDRFSLRHLVGYLKQLTRVPVHFAEDCIGDQTENMCFNTSSGEIVLLENLRFHTEEKKGVEGFAKALSRLGDLYINDAFGTAHRAHASTSIIAQYFSDKKMFGYLMMKELESLKRVLKNPTRPVTAILGGAKIAGKIETIKQLMNVVDNIVIGGGMSYTFIKASGGNIGASLVDPDKIEVAKEIMKSAQLQNVALHLPVDSLIAKEFSNEADITVVAIGEIPSDWIGLDIGPGTIDKFTEIIMNSNTIIWNGPMGVFEMSNFEGGTRAIALAIAHATTKGVYSLVGGGDSVAAVNQFEMADQMSRVSTGGGALLEYMEGKSLPGVEAILN